MFCDRDGVLNRAYVRNGLPAPPRSLEEFALECGVGEGCRRLESAEFEIVVVTNQPDVSRGALDPGELEKMHERLAGLLPVSGIYVCIHDDADGCRCRKPRPGMLYAAAADLGLDLKKSYVIGDRWRDVAAGREAGCRTIHIDRGYLEPAPKTPDLTVHSFADAVAWIVAQGGSSDSHRWEG